MNNIYSNAMKKIMKKPSLILTHITFILIIVVLIGIAGYGYISEKSEFENAKENTELFDPFNEEMEYGQITPVYMSDEFASNYDDSIFYCFLIDEQYYPYIVSVYADEMDKYEDIIEYTYNDVEEPESITLTGKSIEIEDNLLGFAVDAYNVFMGTNNVNIDNIGDQLGYYYIDTTQQPSMDYSVTILYLMILAVIVIIYISNISHFNKSRKRTKETIETYSEHLLVEVDKEINQADTAYFKKEKIYITNNYIISNSSGLAIIPLSNVNHIYGTYKGTNNVTGNWMYFIVETQDGVQHEVLCINNAKKFDKLKDKLVEEIKRRKSEIEIGFEGRFLDSKNINSTIEVDTKDDFSDVTSNVFLGIIGAIVGAAIGGIAWIILGKIGYIAGIAGYFMMYLAIRGYRKLSGFLDKKGQIISLVVALLMIFFANYLSYALDYCKYYTSGSYSIGNILNAFMKIPNFLTVTGGWGDFILNLAIGYGLSIWSGLNIIKSIFSKNK
jgi:uncharacterized protein YpmB